MIPSVPGTTHANDLAESPVMGMLSDHLPLTLLLDLALGVHSREVYVAEPPDLSWLSSGAVRAG